MDALRPATGRRWDLLAFGDPCADIVLTLERLPAIGEKVLGRPIGILAGGTEANVACAVARLGRSAAVFGRVGGDAHGPMLQRAFVEAGVDVSLLAAHASAASASAVTMLDASGERAIVYLPMMAAPADPAARAQALHDAAVAYLMPYDLDDFLQLSAAARAASTWVAIDIEAAVAPDSTAMRRRIEAADIVFFNEDGFRAGTGQAPDEAALAGLLTQEPTHGPRVVVVSRGAAGAVAIDASGYAAQPAFETPVVDTTGAGDSFNAAFLVAWLDRLPLQDALRFACAAASLTVAALGARSGRLDRATVQAIAERSHPSSFPGVLK